MYKIYLSKRLCLNSIHRGLKLEVVDIINLYYSRMRRDYITPTVGIYHYKTDINPIMPLYLIIFISFTGCAMMVTLFVQIESVTRTTRDYIVRVIIPRRYSRQIRLEAIRSAMVREHSRV